MKQNTIPQLNEILMVLRNINDNIRRLEKELFELSLKISRIERAKSNDFVRIVAIKKPNKEENSTVSEVSVDGKNL